jgi:hypothetical protein
MAIASRETLEKFLTDNVFEKQALDAVIFGSGFVSFGAGGVEHVRFEDVFVSCYQSLINKYQDQDDELIACTNLEF